MIPLPLSPALSRALFGMLCILGLSFPAWSARAEPAAAGSPAPLRVIYLEGGDYDNYTETLYGLFAGLARLGVIPRTPDRADAPAMWRQAAAMPSGVIRFQEDGFHSAGWDPEMRRLHKEAILRRIREKGDVDLILALGTWAGVDMATDDHQTPVMVLSTSDAYAAGIIKTPTASGRAHVYAVIAPDWLPRQIFFYHRLFHFKRLGVTYDDSADGRNAVGLHMLHRLSGLLDFILVECADKLDIPDQKESCRRLLACHETLAASVDGMYITAGNALLPENIPGLTAPFTRRGIPTFAQSAPGGVARGILLDISQSIPESEGRFAASALVQIMNGVQPDQAAHLFEGDITISLNLSTARAIGWKPPFSLLQALDAVYLNQEPEKPNAPF